MNRRWGRLLGRPAIGSVAGVLLMMPLVLALAMPAFGAAAKKLSDASVSPRSGTTTTKITFEVTYSRPIPPVFVRVVIDGKNHAMTRVGGGDWSGKDTFRFSDKLPKGTHDIVFQGSGVKDLPAGTVEIKAEPEPTPKPTPKPTPRPAPAPRSAPKPSPTAEPSPTVGPRSVPTPTPEPTPSPTPIASPSPTSDPSPSPTPTPILTGALPGSQPPAGADGSGGSDGGGGGSSPVTPSTDGELTWSPMGSVATALGLGGWRPLPPLQFVPTLVTTTTFAAGMMGMSIFAKRRREEDELDDELLAASAAAGVGMDESVAVAVAAAIAAAPDIPDAEAGMPRWRRPSLLQARKADPIRDGVEAARLTFDNGLIGPIEGRERHLIKYDIVTLLDTPDEIRGNGIGILAQGDEIQLLEKRGVYWLVLCPDGTQGWIHKMTVGENIGNAPRHDGAMATIPAVAESWTLGEDDVDDDVLSAYLAARRRD